MTAKQELYLRIPVSALAAESRALGSAGGSWPRSGHGIMTAKQELYLRIPVSALAAESRALGSAGGTMAAERTWYND